MISIYSQNGEVNYSIIEYILDTEADLAQLSTKDAGSGSTAFIIATSEIYMLNNLREWVKI